MAKRENLEELISAVHEFVDERLEEGNADVTLPDFMGVASLATDQDQKDTDMQASERVTLMTAHASKGLEFSNVFVVGVEEELFPSSMACTTQREVEEERRLLYVAITRAKRFCMLSYASTRFRNGQTVMPQPSRFLRDIDPSLLHSVAGSSDFGHERPTFANPAANYWGMGARRKPATSSPRAATAPQPPAAAPFSGDVPAVGTKVEHLRFGRGVVTNVDTSQADARIVVDFDQAGTKILLLKYAKITIIK